MLFFPKMSLVLALLTIIGGLSKIYKRMVPISLGLELKTFFTILIAFYVGPWAAISCAAIMVIISAVAAGRFCHWILIKIGMYTIVCALVFTLSGFGIGVAGRAGVLVLNAGYIFFNAMLKDFKIFSDLPGNIINVLFNFFLISTLASPAAVLF